MSWLDRLKNRNAPEGDATKTTKTVFVGFVAPSPGHIQKFEGGETPAANDVEPDLSGWTVTGLEVASRQVSTQVATVAGADHETPHARPPVLDPDRDCWPHSSAMNMEEIGTFTERLALFAGRGLSLADAEALADKLVYRDREGDDRRTCMECAHLSGRRCSAWQAAGIGGPAVSVDLVRLPQRCTAFQARL